MTPYEFHRRDDGSYRCESRIVGEGACLVRRRPDRLDEWETATIPPEGTDPNYIVCPVADVWATRQGAIMAHFFYHRTDMIADIHIDRDGYKSLTTNVPDLGQPTIGAGTNFYRLHWDDEQPLVVNRVDYKGDVNVTLDGKIELYLRRAHTFLGDFPTAAAQPIITAAVQRWFLSFKDTTAANEILAATVAKHRDIGLSILDEDISKATKHLAELRKLKRRIEKAGPTEHIHWSETTYELKERNH